MIKSTRALSLMVLAATYQRQGQHDRAATALQMAASDPSLPRLTASVRAAVASSKQTASRITRTRRTASTRQIAAWPFSETSNTGEDLREEPDTNGDREIQESSIEDDLDMMGLSDDMEVAGDVDDFDTDMEFASGDDEDDDDAGEKDDGEKESATAALRRAMNAAAVNAARKAKAKAKKPARK